MADGNRKSSQNLGQLGKTEIAWALQELRSSRRCTHPEILKKGSKIAKVKTGIRQGKAYNP